MATNSQHSTGRSKREMRARSMKTCARQAAAVSTVGAWRPEAHRIAQPSRYVFEYTSAFVVNRENLSLFLRPFGRKKISGVIDRVGDRILRPRGISWIRRNRQTTEREHEISFR